MKTLILKNFQAHSDSVLEFLPIGVNAIGSDLSSAGKSALMRALRGAALNKVTKTKVKTGTKKLTIDIDGVQRIRTKSGAENKYQIGKDVYKAMGKDVPEPVQQKLNLSEINFREQHKPYFLIDIAPGQVAKELNKVADLTLIDKTVGYMKTKYTEKKKEFDTTVEDAATAEAKLEELSWWRGAENAVAVIETTEKNINEIQAKISSLSALRSSLTTLTDKVNSYPTVDYDKVDSLIDSLQTMPDVDGLQKLSTSITTIHKDLLGVLSLERDIERVEKAFVDMGVVHLANQSAQETFRNINSIEIPAHPDFEVAYADIEEVVAHLGELQAHLSYIGKLSSVSYRMGCWDQQTVEAEEAFQEAETIFKQALKEAGVCPLCGN